MKKLLVFCLLLINIYAVNFQTEIDAKYQSDFEESTLPISLKLTGNYLDDNIFSEFQIKGSEEDLLLIKAYGEIYKDKFTYTFGRQPVSWGNSYIFNKMNVLTSVNILNPGEKDNTLDGIKIKYNLPKDSKLEAVVFNVNTADNYGLKYSTVVDNYEYQLSYIKKEKQDQLSNKEEKINDLIFEFKGDLVLGLWGQVAHSFEYDKNNYVLGADYSFAPFDKTLYLLWEGNYSEKTELLLNYFRYNYNFNQWTSLNGGILAKENEQVITTSVNHKLNDAVELNLSYIKVNMDKETKKYMEINFENKIELQLKAVF